MKIPHFLNSKRFYNSLIFDLNKKNVLKKEKKFFSLKRISSREKISFYFQLSTLLSSGIALFQSLDILIFNQKNRFFKSILIEVRSLISQGNYFSKALSHFSFCFNPFLCKMVEAGEKSGYLSETLNELAYHQEEIEKLKNKIIKSLTYPILLFVCSFFISIYIFYSVVPRFEDFFLDMHLPIPCYTKKLFLISHFLNTQWALVFQIFFMLFLFFIIYFLKTSLIFKIPIIKKIYLNYLQIRLSYILIMVLKSGLPLDESLIWVADSLAPGNYKNNLLNAAQNLRKGCSLKESLEKTEIFCFNYIRMIAIGESSGSLTMMLEKTIKWMNNENESIFDQILIFFEPILLIFLGILVLFLIFSIYSPLINLIDVM